MILLVREAYAGTNGRTHLWATTVPGSSFRQSLCGEQRESGALSSWKVTDACLRCQSVAALLRTHRVYVEVEK